MGKHLLWLWGLLLLLLSGAQASAQNQISMPAHQSCFSSQDLSRGFWFVAPSDFTITGLRVPDNCTSGPQNLEVVRFSNPNGPPVYPASTNSFTSLFRSAGVQGNQIVNACIPVKTGDVIGIYGARGASTMYNSYGGNGPQSVQINGKTAVLVRSGMQDNLYDEPMHDIWQEPTMNIQRVQVYYIPGDTVPAVSGGIQADSLFCPTPAAPRDQYEAPANSFADYRWSVSPPGFASVASSPQDSNVVEIDWQAAPAGFYTVAAAPENCHGAGAALTHPVEILGDVPTPGAVSGPQVVCPGGVSSYSIPAVSGSNIKYQWRGLPGGAAFAQSNGGPSISIDWGSAAPGVYTLEVEVDNSCDAKVARLDVTVLPLNPPTPGPIAGPNDVCPGDQSVYLTGNVPNTSYSWSGLPQGASIIQNTGPSITVDWGTWNHYQGQTIQLQLNLTSICGSSSVAKTVRLREPAPNAPQSIIGPPEVCKLGQNDRYEVYPNMPETAYEWKVSGSGTAAVNPLPPDSGFADISWPNVAGLYDVEVKPENFCGAGPSVTKRVEVLPTPLQPASIIGPLETCVGDQSNYSIPNVSGAATYVWTLSGGGALLSPNGAPNATQMLIDWQTPGVFTLTARGNNKCQTGNAASIQVEVVAPPAKPVADQIDSPVCPDHAGVYSVIDNGLRYFWTAESPGQLVSANNSSQIKVFWPANAANGTYLLTVTPYDRGCIGDTARFAVVVNTGAPPQPGPITGPDTVCAGAIVDYELPALPGANAYEWQNDLPAGASYAATRANRKTTINWGTGVAEGNYTVTVNAKNNCGAVAQTKSVYVRQLPGPPAGLTRPKIHCVGEEAEYATPAQPGYEYHWSNSCPWPLRQNGRRAFYTADSKGPCQITVRLRNACGFGPPATIVAETESVLPVPSLPNSDLAACEGERLILKANPVPGAEFVWGNLPGNARYLGGNRGEQVVVDLRDTPPGNYAFTVYAENACGRSQTLNFPVQLFEQPRLSSGINGPVKDCAGGMGTYSIVPQAGANYDWSVSPAGPNLTSSGSIAFVDWQKPGRYTITVTPRNACGAGQSELLRVNVSAKPKVSAGVDRTVCGSDAILSGAPSGGAWSCANCPPNVSLSSFGPYGIVRGMKPESHVFTYEVADPVCGTVTDEVIITNGAPEPGRVLSDATICNGGAGALQLTGQTPQADIIRWEVSEDNFATTTPLNNTTAQFNYSGLTKTSQYRAVLQLHPGCGERHSAHATITVVSADAAPPSPAFQEICGETAVVDGAGAGAWKFVSGPAAPVWNQSGNQLIVSGMRTPGLYRFEWSNNQPPCPIKSYVAEILKKARFRADAGPNVTTCNSAIVLRAQSPASGSWSFVSGPNSANVASSGVFGVVTNLFAPGDYVFRWTPDAEVCADPAFDDVIVTRLASPTTANAGTNKTVCVSSTTLYGNTPQTGTPEWSFVSGPATPQIANFGPIGQVTGMTANGDYVFRYSITNGQCAPSTSEITVVKLDGNIQAIAQPSNIEICDQQTVLLNATPPPAGAQGSWRLVSAPGAGAAIQGSGPTATAVNLTKTGAYVFRWTIASPCGSSFADVRVRRFESAAQPPVAGSNLSVCEKSTALLRGNAPPAGATGVWDFVSGPVPATFNQFGNFASVSDMSQPGVYVFSWTFDNGVCPAQNDVVSVTRVEAPTPAVAGADQRFCASSFTLQGNSPAVGVPSWRQITGPAPSSISGSGATATVTGANVPGTYVFRYEISNPPCRSSADDVRIMIDTGTNPGVLSGAKTVCADNNSGQLQLENYEGAILRWEYSLDGGQTYQTINRTLPTYSFLNLNQTTQYRAVVKSGVCDEAVSNAVTITVTPNTNGIDAGSNQTICGTNALLNGTGLPAGIEGIWSFVSGPVNPSLQQSGSLAIITGMTETGRYFFNWSAPSGLCGTAQDMVWVDIFTPTNGGALNAHQTVCPGQNAGTLDLAGYNGNVVHWEKSEDGGANWNILNHTSDDFNYVNLTKTTHYRVKVENGPCGSAYSTIARITVADVPSSLDAGPDVSVCGSNATVVPPPVGAGTATWSFAGGPAAANVQTNGAMLSASNMTEPGAYRFRLTVDYGACGVLTDELVITADTGSVPGFLQGGTTVCQAGNSGTLSLVGQNGNVVRWESSPGGNWNASTNVIANTATQLPYTNLVETTAYRAVVKTAGCPEAATPPVFVYVSQPPTQANAGGYRSICADNISISGNAPAVGAASWQLLSGPAGASIQTNGNSAQLGNLSPGVYQLEYRIENPPCAASADRSNLSVNPPLAGGSLQGPDSVCVGANSGLIGLSGHSGDVLRWEYSTDGFATVQSLPNPKTSYLFQNLSETTVFRAVVGRPGCGETVSSPFTVNVRTQTFTADAGPDQSVCQPNVSLAANAPAAANGTWSFISGPKVPSLAQNGATASVSGMNVEGTYAFRWTVDNGVCGQDADELLVDVSAQTIPGSLNAATLTHCGASNSGVIQLSGQTGAVVQWEWSNDGNAWAPVNSQSASYAYTNLQATTWFRAVVRNANCTAIPTQPLRISVVTDANAGSISGSDTVCAGNNLGQLHLQNYSGNVTRWEYTEDGQNWIPIPNTGATQSYMDLNKTRRYRAVVEDQGCLGLLSDVAVIRVDSTTNGGAVAGPGTVCANQQSFSLNLTGSRGSVLHWESSANNAFSPANTLAHTSAQLNQTGVSQDVWYRARVQNGVCPAEYSSPFLVEAQNPPNPGIVSGGGEVCADANSGTLVLSGASATPVRWERKPLNGGPIETLNNTGLQMPYANLQMSYLYRAVFSGGACPEAATAWDTLIVSPATNPGLLSGAATVCSGTNSGTLRLNNHAGRVVRWEYSTDNFSTVQQVAQQTDTLDYVDLTQTTRFRAVVQSGVCPEANSATVAVTVTNGGSGGQISGGANACGGSLSGSLTLNGYTGQIEQWETSTDQIAWTPIANTTSQQSYNVSQTTYFRAKVRQGACPAVYSAVAAIELFSPTLGGTITGNGVLCQQNGGAVSLQLNGHLGDIVRWELSYDNFASPPTGIAHTDSIYASQPPAQIVWYRALVQNGSCPPAYSNRFKVERSTALKLDVYGVSGCNNVANLYAVADSGKPAYTYGVSPQVQPDNTTGEFKALPTGVYTVTVKDAAGCQATQQINLTNSPGPAAIIRVTNIATTSAMVEWTEVPPGVSGGVKYNLRYRKVGSANWTTIVNQTTLFRYLGGLVAGETYEVQVQYLCPGNPIPSAWSAGKTFTTLAIRASAPQFAAAKSGWQVYPNPTRGQFYLSNLGGASALATFSLFGSDGKLYFKGETQAGSIPALISLPKDLPAGVYLLRIRRENDAQWLKLICR